MLCIVSSVCWFVMGKYHTLVILQPLLPHKVGVPVHQRKKEVEGIVGVVWSPGPSLCTHVYVGLEDIGLWEPD